MKCPKCHANLYIRKNDNALICLQCKKVFHLYHKKADNASQQNASKEDSYKLIGAWLSILSFLFMLFYILCCGGKSKSIGGWRDQSDSLGEIICFFLGCVLPSLLLVFLGNKAEKVIALLIIVIATVLEFVLIRRYINLYM